MCYWHSKYTSVIPLRDKKGITITNDLQKILDESNCKQNKILVNKVYNRSTKLWLEKNVIEMYLTHNEGKSVVAERFIRTFKDKIYKFMTLISKNRYIDVKLTTHIDFDKKNNKKNPEFKVGDHVRISNYKNIFAKVYVPNWSEEVFVI